MHHTLYILHNLTNWVFFGGYKKKIKFMCYNKQGCFKTVIIFYSIDCLNFVSVIINYFADNNIVLLSDTKTVHFRLTPLNTTNYSFKITISGSLVRKLKSRKVTI